MTQTTETCPYCGSNVKHKDRGVEKGEWEWCVDCDYQTNTRVHNRTDEILSQKETAPEGAVLLVRDDGNIEGSGHFGKSMINKGLEQTDAKYIIKCDENRTFEMSTEDPNKIKNIDNVEVDQIVN